MGHCPIQGLSRLAVHIVCSIGLDRGRIFVSGEYVVEVFERQASDLVV